MSWFQFSINVNISICTNNDYTRPGTQSDSAPLHTPPLQLLEALPCSTKSSSHMKSQESPLLASSLSPSEQEICPLSGALSSGHVPVDKAAFKKHSYMDLAE